MRKVTWLLASTYGVLVGLLWLIYDRFADAIPAHDYLYHELGVLALLSIAAPILVVGITGSELAVRGRVMRGLLMSGTGVLAADLILPERFETLIAHLQIFKLITIGPGLLIELGVAVAIYRMALSGGEPASTAEKIQHEFGMPKWVAKAFVWEALFWHRLHRLLTGRASMQEKLFQGDRAYPDRSEQ
jgi:hypothetical protein